MEQASVGATRPFVAGAGAGGGCGGGKTLGVVHSAEKHDHRFINRHVGAMVRYLPAKIGFALLLIVFVLLN